MTVTKAKTNWLCKQQDSGYVDDCVMDVHVNSAILVARSGDQICIALHW